MAQVKWFDRNFDPNSSQNIFPSIIERLMGTPARLEEKLNALSFEVLIKRIYDTWTIKENLGHLTDLEPLWQGRLEDIINGEIELRPTDLQNNKTTFANHNEMSLDELLHSFREIRKQTISILEKLDEGTIYRAALHPRLKTPMRAMDLFLFVAEHDDHHLARMSELMRMIKEEK